MLPQVTGYHPAERVPVDNDLVLVIFLRHVVEDHLTVPKCVFGVDATLALAVTAVIPEEDIDVALFVV